MIHNKVRYCIAIIFLICFHLHAQQEKSLIVTPLLQHLLDDMQLYKLDSQGEPYLHAGDLYEHSIWTYYGMIELLASDLPYVQNLNLTERQKEIIQLAALLHDIGKAGRKELFDHAHPTLRYDIIKDREGMVSSVIYYQDRQEHPRICFEYAATPTIRSACECARPYYLVSLNTGELIPFNMDDLYAQMGITQEEQKIIAILLGIHYEFGNFKYHKITAADFLQLLRNLVQEVDYNGGEVDEYILRLSILIQVADVKGLVRVPSRPTPLFSEPQEFFPSHQPTKFEDTFTAFGYIMHGEHCCCSGSTNEPQGVQAMNELIEYFKREYKIPECC